MSSFHKETSPICNNNLAISAINSKGKSRVVRMPQVVECLPNKAGVLDPEFKPQYHLKNKKRKYN
jgi:hypothetical protein